MGVGEVSDPPETLAGCRNELEGVRDCMEALEGGGQG